MCSGGGEASGQYFLPPTAAYDAAQGGSDIGGKEAVDQRVSCRVEMCEALNKSSDGRAGCPSKDLEKVKQHVRGPAKDENENDDKGHFDGLHFGFGNQATGGGPSGFLFLLQSCRSGSGSTTAAASRTSGRGRRCGLHGPALLPDGDDDDDVAGADQNGWNEEEDNANQSDVDLPLPLLEGVPTLGAIAVFKFLDFHEK